MKRWGFFCVAFSSGIQEGFYFFLSHKCWGWRLDLSVSSWGKYRGGPQSCLSPFFLLAASRLSSLYHLLTGRLAGRECWRGCDEVRYSSGVPSCWPLICSFWIIIWVTCVVGFFLGHWSSKSEGTFIKKWQTHKHEFKGESLRVCDGAAGSPLGELLSVQINKCFLSGKGCLLIFNEHLNTML